MVCIYCPGNTQVINSRHQKRLNHIWRRRRCGSCGNVFTTSESPELAASLVVESTGGLEPFSRDKLFLSLYDSCRHRPTAQTDATALTSTVIAKLLTSLKDATLSRQTIITTANAVLKNFDHAANVHYTAYHPIKKT